LDLCGSKFSVHALLESGFFSAHRFNTDESLIDIGGKKGSASEYDFPVVTLPARGKIKIHVYTRR